MRPTTRLRILEYLRRHHTATAVELSRSLGMTGANIRHHLAVLEASLLVEVVGTRRQERGRPVQVYSLSRHVLGDGLDDLAAVMFEEWLGGQSSSRQEALLNRIAARLAGDVSRSVGSSDSLPRRLKLAINRLNELHYQARWEAGALGPRVILTHCPYAAIAGRVPYLCRMDALLLENLLRLPVRPSARGEDDTSVRLCVFEVG